MKEIIDDILKLVGITLFLCAVIRYISFYFLYFRSRTLERSSTCRFTVGTQGFSAKVFYRIDFLVPVHLEWLKKVSDSALYLSLTGIMVVLLLIVLQVTI